VTFVGGSPSQTVVWLERARLLASSDVVTIYDDEPIILRRTDKDAILKPIVNSLMFETFNLTSSDEAGYRHVLEDFISQAPERLRERARDGSDLKIVVSFEKSKVGESVFFQNILDADWRALTPTLNQMLNVYCDAVRQDPLWSDSDESIGALSYAARTALFLDPDDTTAFQRYFYTADPQHNLFLVETIMEEFAERFGWSTQPRLELGLFCLITWLNAGTGIYWTEWGVLQAAEKLTPDAFAQAFATASARWSALTRDVAGPAWRRDHADETSDGPLIKIDDETARLDELRGAADHLTKSWSKKPSPWRSQAQTALLKLLGGG
jgi:hypothetical protein